MELVHATQILRAVRAARERAGHLLVGLDFDGTLTAIVPRPQDAVLPRAARQVLERLGRRADTELAVLSGRALDDVRARVDVANVYYAGNHGLEIEGPDVVHVHPAAAESTRAMRSLVQALERELGHIPGVVVEDKQITISVHYRGAAAHEQQRVRDVAVEMGQGVSRLRVTEGKKVVELRPDVDWHKGAALQHIMSVLPHGLAGPALFIGDDLTDEDAFRALPEGGWGIVVAEHVPAHTAASAWLRTPEEVLAWLDELAG